MPASCGCFSPLHLPLLAECLSVCCCEQVALLLKVYDDLKPKALSAEDLMKPRRPSLVQVPGEDVTLDFLSSSSEGKKEEEKQQQQQEQQGKGRT